MSFELSTAGLEYEIGIAAVDAVTLHEAVVGHHVDDLIASIDREGRIRDPVIVDRDTAIVLDGMHRVTAARELGLDGIPVCRVNYRNPAIGLGTWYRVFDRGPSALLRDSCRSVGIETIDIDRPERGYRHWPERPIVVTADGGIELLVEQEDTVAAFETTMAMIDELQSRGLHPRLEPDTADRPSTGCTVVLPRLSKETIVRTARTGRQFPPNTTRHVIPTRPMGVDVPLALLTGDFSAATRRLDRRLADRSIERVPPGSTYAGRTYEEELLVFR